jgi:hypothetical protein
MPWLLLVLAMVGCGRSSSGGTTSAAMQTSVAESDESAKDNKDIKEAKDAKDPKDIKDTKQGKSPERTKDTAKPADAKKGATLKDSLKRYRFRWSDEKESDLPLVIELQVPPVPDEIKGPFPEDAQWRTKEQPAEKKSDEKPNKGIWPWN